MIARLRDAPKAPLAVAALLATPLFFASLMAFSLAVERPGAGGNHPPAGSTEPGSIDPRGPDGPPGAPRPLPGRAPAARGGLHPAGALRVPAPCPGIRPGLRHGNAPETSRRAPGDHADRWIQAEAKIWLLALVPSTLVVLAGAGATLVPRGVLVSALAAVAGALAVTIPLDGWMRDHTARFPVGADFLKDSDPSNSLLRGEWEAAARHTAASLGHWTIGLAAAAAAIAVLGEARRRRGRR